MIILLLFLIFLWLKIQFLWWQYQNSIINAILFSIWINLIKFFIFLKVDFFPINWCKFFSCYIIKSISNEIPTLSISHFFSSNHQSIQLHSRLAWRDSMWFQRVFFSHLFHACCGILCSSLSWWIQICHFWIGRGVQIKGRSWWL